jgi:hypothetical protein
MKSLLITIIVLFAFSCQQKGNVQIIPANMSDTIVTEKEKPINKQLGDTINLVIKDEKGMFVADGKIDSIHPRIYARFTNTGAGNLKAVIIPMEADGNIRFNQIIFPDGTADGPFGKEVELKLKQTGEYTLIIGHSQMADGQYQGKFKIVLQVQDN